MKLLRPALAALLFAALVVYFTYYLAPTLHYLNMSANSELALFISSPFNMSTEGAPLYNLVAPAIIIFALGVYLKNFNKSFQRKANLRSVLIMAVIASYVKSLLSMATYVGYADYGISLGTSIITLSFLAVFVISLEVYVERQERFEHLYGHFMFAVLSMLIMLLAIMVFLSFFFHTNSFIVHLFGITAFLLMFVPFYERDNLKRFFRKEEHAIERDVEHIERRAERS